ncbi:PIG-L family deacetylase [Cellulomonas sp. IC4_254]|uniref:PIG-L family deacetylase n=1 Tax=Cellulomonas sp. IC4_254 TaxID=2714040 RepID=UPI00142118C4|nr:PIG-L family deacetylase [Cellulomonas sp. IC4_254]NHT16470.1 GlcNAc-PI de-N-acetylase [Cellulomonas sp. IC4_254]
MSTTASTPTRTGGVLAVHAHPDDETLSTGALLATWAAAGLPATVVTCTRGERGEVIGAALAALEGDGPALAGHRESEIAAAAAALGATQLFLDTLPLPVDLAERAADVPSGRVEGTSAARSAHGTRYEDSGMAWVGTGRAGAAADVPAGALVAVPLDEAAGRLALLLRARRPDVVVTYEPGGGYGHPDHVRAHAITMRAVELAAGAGPDSGAGEDRWAPAVAWAVAPAAALRAGYAALATDPVSRAVLAAAADDRRATREAPLTLPDPTGPLPSVATDAPADLVVDVLPVRDRVLAALRAHATQVQAVTPLDHPDAVACYALSNLVLAPVLPTESYTWAPGRAPAAPLPL